MRISELSQQSGLPVATIKFYLRERLLPPGTRTARNQADYGEGHLVRLRLIQILTGIGRFSLSSVREVLSAVDDRSLLLGELCKVVNQVLFPAALEDPSDCPEVAAARRQVDSYVDSLGWRVDPQAPARFTIAQVLAALRRLGWDYGAEIFAPYAEAAERLSAHDVESMFANVEPIEAAMTLIGRMVLFEAAFGALRAMAQEHHLTLRQDRPSGHGDSK